MPLLLKTELADAAQLPSGAPKLIVAIPGPMALASVMAAVKLVVDGSGALINTVRASGAVTCTHCTSSAISVAQPGNRPST
ncbi:MAG TPA: hypothetical protein VIF60_23385 [Burkholderiaceae bacterium]|jgi:hypothetical protein